MRPSFCHTLALASLFLCSAGVFPVAAGAEPPSSSPEKILETGATTISARLEAFGRDLERLRRFMGAPKASELDIGIHGALPRDLYFQTLTLWQKTDRLSFEVMRIHSTPLQPAPGDIGQQDILLGLEDATRILRQVLQELRIPSAAEPPPEPKVPADPFTAIVYLNRQLNLLLERHIGPSDVYMEITLAIGYSARILSRYPESDRIPAEPPFEPDKQPGDVYRRLIECLRSIARIFDQLGLPVLRIDPGRTDPDSLQPSDVYLVAAMIVSQLDFLHKYLDIAKAPPQPIYPGYRFPAHSYQRAGILQSQLTQLERFLATDQAALAKTRHDIPPVPAP